MTGLVRLFRYAFYALTVAGMLLAGGFVLFVNAIDRKGSKLPAAEGVVALTGGKDRIGQAFKLLATGQAKRLLITGVHSSTKASQLQHLVPRGAEFFPCCVDLGRAALDTRGNAAETRGWAQKHSFSSLIVVTSSYHMPRTLIEFSRAMPDIQLIPYAVVSPNFHIDKWWSHLPTRRLLFSEYVKYLNALVGSTRPGGTIRSSVMAN